MCIMHTINVQTACGIIKELFLRDRSFTATKSKETRNKILARQQYTKDSGLIPTFGSLFQ